MRYGGGAKRIGQDKSYVRQIWTNHEDRPSSVEAGPVRVLPNILDLVRVPTDEPLGEVLVCTLNRLGVAF